MTYQERKDLAISYMNNKEKDNDFRPLFSRIYPFSTENLTGFFNPDLLKDKNKCITHNNFLDIFCYKCHIQFCSKCDENNKHISHKIISF